MFVFLSLIIFAINAYGLWRLDRIDDAKLKQPNYDAFRFPRYLRYIVLILAWIVIILGGTEACRIDKSGKSVCVNLLSSYYAKQ